MSNKELYYASDWVDNYNVLIEYYNKNKNIDISYDAVINNRKIGIWLENQRTKFKNGNLDYTRVKLLNKLGMRWYIRGEDRQLNWNAYYKLAKEYYKKYKTINIPRSVEVNGIMLGRWIGRQRLAYNGTGAYKITKEQILLLNELGMDWDIKETQRLNTKKITDMEVYNEDLISRVNNVLKDLKLENINEIKTKRDKKTIEKEMIKRIWK